MSGRAERFEWLLALRFLREGRLQTLFILVGIAIGVGVIVFMSELLAGLQSNFVQRVLTGQSHIQVLPPKAITRALAQPGLQEASDVQAPPQRSRTLDQWQPLRAQMAQMPDITQVSPLLTGSALITRGAASKSISLNGIEEDSYLRIVPLDEKIVAGRFGVGSDDLLIGIDLARDLGVQVGDRLHLSTGTGSGLTLTVRGLFDMGSRGANQRSAYVSLRQAQSLLGLLGQCTSLEVTVRDVWQADEVARRIGQLAPLEVDSWVSNNAQFFSSLHAQTMANTAIRFFVGLSVAFGIASVLVVSVVQRSKEIGILRAMGVTRGQVLRVFLLQGGLLGLGGAALGCLLGLGGLTLWQTVARNPDGTVLWALQLHPPVMVGAVVLAGLTGVLAALAPALRAARLDPVLAIRA
ncbi:MAG: ABC transporter permease [Burkholderiaceae bacterium]|nr:MAG: ABC transporter permease [Burkholderiaceae bacterium]